MRPTRGFAEVNGARLYYETAGSGEPLVLVHGFSLDTRVWDGQWEAFSGCYRVIRYDLRGFGKSSLPDGGGYSHHEDLKALLDWLGVSPARVLGHSTGGSIALDFAVSHPEMLRALVLFGSIAAGFDYSPEFAGALGSIYAAAQMWGIGSAREIWLRLLDIRPVENPDAAAELHRIVADYSGWHWLNADPAISLDPPALQRLDAIRAPTLTILGEREVPDCFRIAERVNRGVPGAEQVVLPGLGHMAHMEAPSRFNDAVLGFLERSAAP
ncbi:MAG TPA: alpha/beta hydrolase [Longimicrobium sp.]|nr:alpha/beta hydrolase [Longimicrobium sp.]